MGLKNLRKESLNSRRRNSQGHGGFVASAAIDLAIRRREDKATAMRIFKNMLQKLIDDGILSNGSSVDSQGSVRIPGESKRVDIFTFFPDDEQK